MKLLGYSSDDMAHAFKQCDEDDDGTILGC